MMPWNSSVILSVGWEQIGLLEGDVVSGRATERHGLPSE